MYYIHIEVINNNTLIQIIKVVVLAMVMVMMMMMINTGFPVYGPVNVISKEYWCFPSFEAVEMTLRISPVMKLYNNHEMDQ
jgi:hypothetical protein